MGKAMVPIGVIADLVCDELGDNNVAKKTRILQYIALGYQQMHLLLNQDFSIKSEIISVDGGYQYELPCDFIYETKVGLKKGKQVWTLRLNTDLERSTNKLNDTDTLNQRNAILNGTYDENFDCYFYNVFSGDDYCFGSLGAHGRGIHNGGYYNIVNGVLNISPFIVGDDEDLELIVEYKSDGLTNGLELVPSEAFLALRFFAKAEYFSEDAYGKNRVLWESQFKTIKNLYNRTGIDVIAEIFSR